MNLWDSRLIRAAVLGERKEILRPVGPVDLAPYVTRIVFNSVLVQKSYELRFKIHFAVVFGLRKDGVDRAFELGLPNRKCTIAFLPFESQLPTFTTQHLQEPPLSWRIASSMAIVVGIESNR